jgi:hypothetical protein
MQPARQESVYSLTPHGQISTTYFTNPRTRDPHPDQQDSPLGPSSEPGTAFPSRSQTGAHTSARVADWNAIRECIQALPSHGEFTQTQSPTGHTQLALDRIPEQEATLPTDDGFETQKLENLMEQQREQDEARTWSHWFPHDSDATGIEGGHDHHAFESQETSDASSRSMVDSDDIEPPWETSSVVESSVVEEIPMRLPPDYWLLRGEVNEDRGPPPSAAF